MAKIEGRFATLNNTHTVKVCIYNKNLSKPNINIDASNSVKFSDNPVEITQQQDDTFEHILKTQCKIRLVTKEWLGDYLFAANYSSIVVNVWVDNDCVFCGYVVPQTYNQSYAHQWEEVEINCVDILSTLQDRRLTDNTTYEELVAQSTTRPFSWFLDKMDLDTLTVVIPNYPDIDYQEAEMMWTEIDWSRIVTQEGDITYYGVEAEVVMLDEETAMNTGNTRQGQQKTPTWIESTDTCIVDGVSYYKEYAHITVAGNDVNTGDWRVGSNAGGMPVVVRTEDRVDGWTTGVLPQPFDFYEHYTTYNIYDNGMEIAASDGIGEQIPESPNTTTAGSYYEFRQGSEDDLDVDEDTGYMYYKEYAWVCVNNECTNSGQWQRGQRYSFSSNYLTIEATTNGTVSVYLESALTTTDLASFSYSKDKNNWTTWTNDQQGTTITVSLNAGEKLYLKGSGQRYKHQGFNSPDPIFTITCNANVYGNILSLLYGNNFALADTVYDYSFNCLFKNCNIINTQNLELPATVLGEGCYGDMFQGCTSLTTAPSLPATNLSIICYSGMFNDCTSLTTAPSLPATNTLPEGCYAGMFNGCTSLTTAPSLPATTLNNYCYAGMFNGCTSLTTAPSLPATTIGDRCYESMFEGCSSLTAAPALNVTNYGSSNCCYRMFADCTSLTTVPSLPSAYPTFHCYDEMFKGCTSLTTAPALPATAVAQSGYTSMFQNCTSLTTAPALPATTLMASCYAEMFMGCVSLTTAPSTISATYIPRDCCSRMFRDCSSLTTAPSLPTTSLEDYCYREMFEDCTALTTAPALPATTLPESCYDRMFYGCTSLTTAPTLPATSLAWACYSGMFYGCTSLTTAPTLPATTLIDNCYQSMFNGCTSLTTAPTLPATTLVSQCYFEMFYGCSHLSSITMLATDISATECLTGWVYGVASSGTFTKAASMTSLPTGNDGIPSGWTIQNA